MRRFVNPWLAALGACLVSCSFSPNQPFDASPGGGSDSTIADAPPMIDAPLICPARYDTKFNGHSYFGTGALQYAAADAECKNDQIGHLIKIETDEEALELADRVDILIGPSFAWIGLSDKGSGLTWTDNTPPTFARWASNNPGTQLCVAEDTTDGDGHWRTADCTANTLIGICECDGE